MSQPLRSKKPLGGRKDNNNIIIGCRKIQSQIFAFKGKVKAAVNLEDANIKKDLTKGNLRKQPISPKTKNYGHGGVLTRTE